MKPLRGYNIKDLRVQLLTSVSHVEVRWVRHVPSLFRDLATWNWIWHKFRSEMRAHE